MMKIAIISDIHSNLEALKAVLRTADKHEVDTLVNLGDIVGYNANPEECVKELRQRNAISIVGNHDRAVYDVSLRESFSVLAIASIKWSRQQLSKESINYLRKLPIVTILWDRFLICHGTLRSCNGYIAKPFQARRTFNILSNDYRSIRICFFGHTHKRAIWKRDVRGKVTSINPVPPEIALDEEDMYLINPGSVGQPRQNDWRASFLIFEPGEGTIRFFHVPYDLYNAQRKILDSRLPAYLAERLAEGT